jgi:hypothetical protein
MVAVDYLSLIEQGVEAWNRWRSEHPDVCPDLEAAYLFERSLSGINFRNVNLMRACLIGADLSQADLTGANLRGVYANTADFRGAVLAFADLRGGSLIEANFSQADVSHARVENANLTSACLRDADLSEWSAVALTQLDATQQSEARLQQISGIHPEPEPGIRFPVLIDCLKPGGKARLQALRWPSVPRQSVLVGITGIALASGISMLYLVSRSDSGRSATTVEPVPEISVCNPSASAPLATASPDHRYQDGTQFYGRFMDGQPADGFGTMLYANGNRYDGEYQNGRRNGCGTFTFKNGRRYVGEFKEDLFSGRGSWFLENGDRYIGQFEYNKCNGEGVFIFADGTSQSGVWQQGRLVGGDLSCDRNPANQSE